MPKNNVNPDHYKVAGRERPGEDIPQTQQKERLSKSKASARSAGRTRVPPAPAESGGRTRSAAATTRKSAKRG
jgi:hypothetical protein